MPVPSSIRVPGSGVVPLNSVSTTLSSPLLLSLGGSPFRKPSVVEPLVALKMWVNCSQFCVVGLTVEFVSEKVGVPFIETLTVLVVPKIPPPVVFPT